MRERATSPQSGSSRAPVLLSTDPRRRLARCVGGLLALPLLLLATPAFADFCSGRANGYWCDGSDLVLCSGGSVASRQNCPNGCHSSPPGVDDYCESGGSGACAGLSNGYWCDGDDLILCQSGSERSRQHCDYGCHSSAAGVDDYCEPPPSGPCSGLSNGYWCDGDDLILCQGGNVASRQHCDYGCHSSAAGVDDYCEPPPSGPCSGLSNGYWCDGSDLILCQGGNEASRQSCPYGCHSSASGVDDYCEPPPSGPCSGLSNGYWCDGSDLILCQGGSEASRQTCPYGCHQSAAGVDDYCESGSTGACTGLANGYWCDGADLILCQGGSEASRQTCPNGCHQSAAGVDDYCESGSTGACTGLANGYWCDGADLILCQGGSEASRQTCPNGCHQSAAGVDDYCESGSTGACTGLANGYWCDGADLILCQGGSEASRQTCPNGCHQSAAGVDDYCESGSTGACTGLANGYWCDGADLILCQGGSEASRQTCPNGCHQSAAGVDDYCESGSTGACTGLSNGYWCSGSDLMLCQGGVETSRVPCPNGCHQSAVGVDDYCESGTATSCTGLSNGYWCSGSDLMLCQGGVETSRVPCPNGCHQSAVGVDDYCEGELPAGSPELVVYPVRGPHNGGWDANALTFTCPPHPASSPDNSDYIPGDHYGNDIFAARGTPLVACVDGVISGVTHNNVGIGGRTVYIDDNAGWTYYYAHLDSVEPSLEIGDPVSAGDPVGTLGDSGSALGTAPHLHFSTYRGDYWAGSVDPFPSLQASDHTSCVDDSCVPDCAGKNCGYDGCTGSCGNCAAGERCDAGLCVPVSTPGCPTSCVVGSRRCVAANQMARCELGGDGCPTWQSVPCAADAECYNDQCTVCAVAGQACGLDNCGNLVAACPSGQVCDGLRCVAATEGRNPTPAELDAAIAQLVRAFPIEWVGHDGQRRTAYVPTRIVKAVMWQESGWTHYGSNGRVLSNGNGDSSDYGLMQINGPNDDPVLSTQSWMQNLSRGIEILREKWTWLAYEFEDPTLLENWYYPLAAYNGLSLGGVNDPSATSPQYTVAYYAAHPDLIANHITYQDRIYGIAEAPSEWPVNVTVRSQGKFADLGGRLVRPYAIPQWITRGVAWSAQGYTWVRAYTAEADSFGRPEDVPALHSFGLVLHRWVEDGNGGHVELVAPPGGGSGSGTTPQVVGWQVVRTTNATTPIPYTGSIVANGDLLRGLRFVIATANGSEDVQSYDFNPPVGLVDLGAYAFDPGRYGGTLGRYVVGLWVRTVGGGDRYQRLQTAEITVVAEGFRLHFPVAGYTAWNAPINSVFDHSMGTPYRRDARVVAYTGEVASGSSPCTGAACSYESPDGEDYVVNGNYVGAWQPSYLWYDGHPGLDYNFVLGTRLYATAPGTVSMPEPYGSDEYNVLQIDHGNGYVTQYWHCNSHLAADDAWVEAGDPVATVGDEGSPGAVHLHLEIQYQGVPVDPYGWQGEGADPYTAATSTNLWGTPPGTGGAVPCLTACVGNTLCSGEQCLLRCLVDADCPDGGLCAGGLCAPACAAAGDGACVGQNVQPTDPASPDAGGDTVGPGAGDGGLRLPDQAPDGGALIPVPASRGAGCQAAGGLPDPTVFLLLALGLVAALVRRRRGRATNFV